MPPPTNLAIWPASTVSRLSASRPRCGGASSPRCDERRYGDVGCSGAAVAQRRSGTDVDVEQKDHKHRHLGFSKCGDWDSFSPGYKVDVVSYILYIRAWHIVHKIYGIIICMYKDLLRLHKSTTYHTIIFPHYLRTRFCTFQVFFRISSINSSFLSHQRCNCSSQPFSLAILSRGIVPKLPLQLVVRPDAWNERNWITRVEVDSAPNEEKHLRSFPGGQG